MKIAERLNNLRDNKVRKDFLKRIKNSHLTKSPFVTVCIVSNGEFSQKVLDSIYNQDYSNYDVIIYINKKPLNIEGLKEVEIHSFQCSANRQRLKSIIKNTKCDYMLTIDMDTWIPPNTISSLVKQAEHSKYSFFSKPVKVMTNIGVRKEVKRKAIFSGWCLLKDSDLFIGGEWVADNTFRYFDKIKKGVSRTDVIPMGCTLFPKDILEKLTIFPGDRSYRTDFGLTILSDECLQVVIDLQNMGYECYLDSSVVCKHLKESEM